MCCPNRDFCPNWDVGHGKQGPMVTSYATDTLYFAQSINSCRMDIRFSGGTVINKCQVVVHIHRTCSWHASWKGEE